jgi:hypothetical protein
LRVQKRLADRQPQSEAAVASDHIVRPLLERAEQALAHLFHHADAAVPDENLNPPAVVVACAELDAAAFGRELRRVLQDVPEYLL